MPRKLVEAARHRARTIVRYGRRAPTTRALLRWIIIGAIRGRLFGGEARVSMQGVDCLRRVRVQIGPSKVQQVVVDVTSHGELSAFEEIFLDNIYDLRNVPFVPSLVLDCGANVGFFASVSRVCFPNAQTVCWEPEPHNFARLCHQPLLQDHKAHLYAAAVSDTDGEAWFSGTGVGGHLTETASNAGRPVRIMNLTAWFRHNVKSPTIVKIDIEGHETNVVPSLRGLWPSPCALFIETHAEYGRDETVLNELNAQGFDLKMLRQHCIAGDKRVFKEYFGLK